MRLNRAGPKSSDAAGRNPLQQRLAGLTGQPPSGVVGAAPVLQGVEARERLRAGGHTRSRRTRMSGDAGAKAPASKTWHVWVVFDILLLLLIVPLVVAVPPVLDCRKKQDHGGFVAGDSFEQCAKSGISERWTTLDGQLKLLVRNSGF